LETTNLDLEEKKMIRLTTENTQKAIAKCKQLKLTVKFIKE